MAIQNFYIKPGLLDVGLGDAFKQRRLRNEQQEQQQMQSQAMQDIFAQAEQGDYSRVPELLEINPQLFGMLRQEQQRKQAGMDAQQLQQTQQATNEFDALLLNATEEQLPQLLAQAKANPLIDFDEEDMAMGLPQMKTVASLRLASNNPEYFKTIQKGQDESQTNFAPTVSSLQTDPETGQKYVAITDRNTGEVKRVDAKDAVGETLIQEQDREFRAQSLDDARQISKDSFTELKNIKSSIGTINEALSAIDKGAQSGFVDKFFPSFRESTIALENAAQRMGLDVISATTFGALSEGELKLAMDTAMPKNLNPKELKKWLTDRKKAKTKLANELTKMAITLGKGKTTIAEYLEQNATFSGGEEVTNWDDL